MHKQTTYTEQSFSKEDVMDNTPKNPRLLHGDSHRLANTNFPLHSVQIKAKRFEKL